MPFDFLKGRSPADAAPGGGADPLQSLRDFTVTVEYGRKHTTYEVRDRGRGRPVVRMHKAVAAGVTEFLHVSTVAEPEVELGRVLTGRALAPDGRTVGNCATVRFASCDWAVEQPEIGTMQARWAGVSRVTESPLGVFLPVVNHLMPLRMEFGSAAGPAFTFARSTGVRSEYRLTVADDRVSRLMLLALTERFNEYVVSDPRQALVKATANPFVVDGPEVDALNARRRAAIKAAKQNRKHGDQAN